MEIKVHRHFVIKVVWDTSIYCDVVRIEINNILF